MNCGDCGGKLEVIEFAPAGVVLDTWVQHVDPASLCSPVLPEDFSWEGVQDVRRVV